MHILFWILGTLLCALFLIWGFVTKASMDKRIIIVSDLLLIAVSIAVLVMGLLLREQYLADAVRQAGEIQKEQPAEDALWNPDDKSILTRRQR